MVVLKGSLYVNVDCFGPLEVHRGRSLVQRYGVLFTCLSIRAIHIAVMYSLHTDSFINVLRQFIAPRGQPLQMRSDNVGKFVKGERQLREAVNKWSQTKIHSFLLSNNIMWIFNPPGASHHSGVWERCIRTTRIVMKALLKEQPLNNEGLLTLRAEVESIIKDNQSPRCPMIQRTVMPSHQITCCCSGHDNDDDDDDDSRASKTLAQIDSPADCLQNCGILVKSTKLSQYIHQSDLKNM